MLTYYNLDYELNETKGQKTCPNHLWKSSNGTSTHFLFNNILEFTIDVFEIGKQEFENHKSCQN